MLRRRWHRVDAESDKIGIGAGIFRAMTISPAMPEQMP